MKFKKMRKNFDQQKWDFNQNDKEIIDRLQE
mgnify:CR=1 FL=1